MLRSRRLFPGYGFIRSKRSPATSPSVRTVVSFFMTVCLLTMAAYGHNPRLILPNLNLFQKHGT